MIDEQIRLPITMLWNDGSRFHVRVAKQAIVVDALWLGLAAA